MRVAFRNGNNILGTYYILLVAFRAQEAKRLSNPPGAPSFFRDVWVRPDGSESFIALLWYLSAQNYYRPYPIELAADALTLRRTCI